jgi:hypothetical protein
VLVRLRRLPSAPEASSVLDAIASEGRLADAARALAARVGEVPKRPKAVLDAVLTWVVRQAEAFRPPVTQPPRTLRLRAVDWALTASALAPLLAIVLG